MNTLLLLPQDKDYKVPEGLAEYCYMYGSVMCMNLGRWMEFTNTEQKTLLHDVLNNCLVVEASIIDNDIKVYGWLNSKLSYADYNEVNDDEIEIVDGKPTISNLYGFMDWVFDRNPVVWAYIKQVGLYDTDKWHEHGIYEYSFDKFHFFWVRIPEHLKLLNITPINMFDFHDEDFGSSVTNGMLDQIQALIAVIQDTIDDINEIDYCYLKSSINIWLSQYDKYENIIKWLLSNGFEGKLYENGLNIKEPNLLAHS